MVCLKSLPDQFRGYTGQCSVSEEEEDRMLCLSKKSQDHRIAQTGRDLRKSLLELPAHSRLSSEVRSGCIRHHPVKTSRLLNLHICLTVLMGKKFLDIIRLKLFWFSFSFLFLILAPCTTVKIPSPSPQGPLHRHWVLLLGAPKAVSAPG